MERDRAEQPRRRISSSEKHKANSWKQIERRREGEKRRKRIRKGRKEEHLDGNEQAVGDANALVDLAHSTDAQDCRENMLIKMKKMRKMRKMKEEYQKRRKRDSAKTERRKKRPRQFWPQGLTREMKKRKINQLI